ncbi:O-antigen polymerase [Marinilactibacillus psychrotolerans]|uniref:O-antigen polymerase n=1 Tax=Marinilactibacillus psychrotolerans TaxID=191770 RepID=UPI003886DB60
MENINIVLSIVLVFCILVNFRIKSQHYFFINLFNFMNSLGIILYSFGLKYYKIPSDNAITIALLTFITLNIAYIFYSKLPKLVVQFNEKSGKLTKKKKYYFVFFVIPPLMYFLVFRGGFSLYQMLTGVLVSESSRADVSGSLPKYYTFSVFVTSLGIPYMIEMFKNTKGKLKMTFLGFLVFFSLLLGNKSTILAIVFFLYLYNSKNFRINLSLRKIVGFSVIFILVYSGVKFAYGSTNNLSSMIESIFRRVIMINASLYGNFIDYFVINSGTIPDGFAHIKQFMFYYIYGYLPGGASVNYLASIIRYIGFGVVQLFVVFFSVLYVMYFRDLVMRVKLNHFREAVNFLNFYGAIILVNGYLSDYLIRVLLPIIFFIVIDKLTLRKSNLIKHDTKGWANDF